MACAPFEDIIALMDGSEKRLGRGSFGTVDLVGEYVVKKIFTRRSATVEDKFREEVQVWEDLWNSATMRPYLPEFCYGRIEGPNGYIIQRYEPVTPLDKRIAKRLPFEEGYSLFNSLIKGFDTLFAAGYIHRDIKPQNILVRDGGGEPIIIDFGLACKVPCEARNVKGTYGYFPVNWKHVSERPVARVGQRLFNKPKYAASNTKNSNYESVSSFLGSSSNNNVGPGISYGPSKSSSRQSVSAKIIKPRYTKATDRYALAETLEQLSDAINWGSHKDEEAAARRIIQMYRGQMVAELAASAARGNVNTGNNTVAFSMYNSARLRNRSKSNKSNRTNNTRKMKVKTHSGFW